MCGIVGALSGRPIDPAVGVRMREMIHHRGPDHGGLWQNDDHRVCLAHRRLAIIDLNAEANQPWASTDGRFQIVVNGEIYNYRALRTELEREGVRFRTSSDTEVLVEMWRRHGAAGLPRLSGQFAFAIWDDHTRSLYCARDRAGEKPFHYAMCGDSFVFASELKALVQWPGFERRVNPRALIDVLAVGLVADPKTIWAGCHKLPPGHWMEVRLPAEGRPVVSEPAEYWDFTFAPDNGSRDWNEEIRETIRAAAAEMAVADVPLGTFLSGGVDSSAVTAALSRAGHAVRSFTIGFDERGYDERPWARRVAELYRTEHHERVVKADDADEAFDMLLRQLDEPFGDYSFLPTYYLCREARPFITVALSGDGGDEVFGGYRRYQRLGARAALERFVPPPMLRAAATATQPFVRDARGRRALRQYAAAPAEMLTDVLTLGLNASELRPHARGALAQALSEYSAQDEVARHLRRAPPEQVGLINAMRYLDLKLTLAGGMLVKVDRSSMAVSLEVRAVFLHHRILALAGQIPPHDLAGPRTSKHALKRALEAWLPHDLLYRKKMGFALPLPMWLRDRDAKKAKAASDRLGAFIDPRFAVTLSEAHASQRGEHTATIHNLRVLEHWLATWTS